MARALLIGVTGTPGSGKSSFASTLSKKTGFKAVEINSVLESLHAYRTDRDGTKIADLKKLEKAIKKTAGKGNLILVGHLAQELDLPYSCMIVMRIGIGKLNARLERRKYGKAKLVENLVCEATDYCGAMSRKRPGPVLEIETEREKAAAVKAVKSGFKDVAPALLRPKSKMKEFAGFIKGHRQLGL
jgi:broad-specificity NMP kinase